MASLYRRLIDWKNKGKVPEKAEKLSTLNIDKIKNVNKSLLADGCTVVEDSTGLIYSFNGVDLLIIGVIEDKIEV